uniref:ATP synthase subunit a n=1 Tax=Megalyra sp. MM-2014 TaxID=1503221 RepID=A0A096XKZ6_9HYME|nr:ATP synthase F0 subunit 6 [Megalyra sp. MM-2014]
MMMNLFSSFDPCVTVNISMNWLSSFMLILLYPLSYYVIPSLNLMIYNKLIYNLMNEFKIMLTKFNYLNLLMFMSIFMFIFMNNFMGLFPYIFTSSSHLSFTMTLSLPIWLGCMIFGWFKNMEFMFSHLVPVGTPLFLMFFMVLIETISNLIRPLTLSVRLMANMIAGHLIITLVSSVGVSLNLLSLMILIIIQIVLLLLELSVAVIQAYVFMILLSLYSKETN